MQEIVINARFGGFGLSSKAWARLRELGMTHELNQCAGPRRDDPRLVQVVRELGDAASASPGDLEVIEVPDGVEWIVEEYDGAEWVAEKHRTWPAQDLPRDSEQGGGEGKCKR